MRYVVTALAILFFNAAVYAQTWERLIPDWDAVHISELLDTRDGSIYAACFNSTLLKSDDGGKIWRDLNLPFEYMNLSSIDWDGRYIFLSGASFDHKLFPVTSVTDSMLRLFRYDIHNQSFIDISIIRDKPDNYPHHPLILPPLVSCSGGYVFVSEQRNWNYPCVLRKSSDQGLTWHELEVPGEMQSFEAMNDSVLVAVSKSAGYDTLRIYRSNNGGESWDIVYTESLFGFIDNVPISISGESASAVIAVGTGMQVLVSEDAGFTWRRILTIPWNFNDNASVNAIFVDSTGSMIVVGEEADVYTSTDYGVQWAQTKEKERYQQFTTSIIASELGPIIVANSAGTFFRSEDRGITWNTLRSSEMSDITRLHFFDNRHGFLQGSDSKGAMAYYTTSDGGQIWRRCASLPTDIRGIIAGVSTESILYGYGKSVIGDSTVVTIYSSTNRGDTWNAFAASSFAITNALNVLYDASGVFLIGSIASSQDNRIWYSIDTGKSWKYNVVTERYPQFTHAEDASGAITIYRYMTRDNIYKSPDSGRTWLATGFFTDSSYSVFGFQSLTPNDLYCKVNWKPDPTGPTYFQQYISDNGGFSWQRIRENIHTQDYSTAIFRGDVIYWYYFSHIRIMGSQKPWINEEASLWKDYAGRSTGFFLDNDNIWLVSGPTIYRTTNGGTSWTELPFTVQDDAAIKAIYPNPVMAGQSVSIEIGPPQSPHAVGGWQTPLRIAIYDLLGREVAVLYNGPADPGTRTLTWNPAPTLPAGMYVVRMSHGEKVWAKQVAVLR